MTQEVYIDSLVRIAYYLSLPLSLDNEEDVVSYSKEAIISLLREIDDAVSPYLERNNDED